MVRQDTYIYIFLKNTGFGKHECKFQFGIHAHDAVDSWIGKEGMHQCCSLNAEKTKTKDPTTNAE
jgi:hypothetical protein